MCGMNIYVVSFNSINYLLYVCQLFNFFIYYDGSILSCKRMFSVYLGKVFPGSHSQSHLMDEINKIRILVELLIFSI